VASRMTMVVCRVCKYDLEPNGEGVMVDPDGTPYCSVVDEEPHEPVTLVELPTVDQLTDLMVADAAQGTPSQRFRNSMKGWAKLALKVMGGSDA